MASPSTAERPAKVEVEPGSRLSWSSLAVLQLILPEHTPTLVMQMRDGFELATNNDEIRMVVEDRRWMDGGQC